jgi:hypothetical protein
MDNDPLNSFLDTAHKQQLVAVCVSLRLDASGTVPELKGRIRQFERNRTSSSSSTSTTSPTLPLRQTEAVRASVNSASVALHSLAHAPWEDYANAFQDTVNIREVRLSTFLRKNSTDCVFVKSI